MYTREKLIADKGPPESANLEEALWPFRKSIDEIGLRRFRKKVQRILEDQAFMRNNFERFTSLTNREEEILTLLALGHNNPKIADLLFISRRTVEQHRKNINYKLGIKSFPDILKYAQAFDLI
ncbi:helix-turn-helix transcriptional regulator [Fulvivirgaceae bacterium BMA10]|uniref:Helix-turn-helix transcriptional regulator n=1 Tax=Splendidivirga corallicola TaxID=3051826 RepID=A0ABT8L128_9BACT|nr:helix-turn-helix transcriptional regulator [Fulvivirgaceae bacterium BMA10]